MGGVMIFRIRFRQQRPLPALLAAVLTWGLVFDNSAAPLPSGLGGAEALGAAVAGAAEARRGYAALAQGDLRSAESAFRESLRADPRFSPANVGLAEVELRRGKVGEAHRLLQEALKIRPDDSLLLAAMGRLHASQNDAAQALVFLNRAVKSNPANAAAYADIGDIQLSVARRFDDAIAAFRASIKADQRFTRARVGLGLAFAAKGQFEEAIRELAQAAEIEKTDPAIPHMIGRIHAQRKDLPSAIDAFTAALKRRADFEPALRDRADAAAELKRDELAVADYQAILRIAPNDAQTMVKLGMLYGRIGREKEAEQTYRNALRVNPNFAVAYNNLAWMAVKRRTNLDEALTWAKKAVELAPQVPQFLDTLGSVHRARGQLNEAVAAFEAATKLQPPLAEAHYHLGITYLDLGRRQEANAAFRRALEISKDFVGAEDARTALTGASK